MVEMLELVRNEEKYWDFIRVLRNLNDGFVEKVNITPEQQSKYMKKYGEFYRIALKDNVPVGFIGHINNDIRIAVSSEYRNQGIAVFMINEFMKLYPKAFAKIQIENEASIKAFEKAGFKKKFYLLEK